MFQIRIPCRIRTVYLLLIVCYSKFYGQQNPADSARQFLMDQFDRCHRVSYVYLNGNDACDIFTPHGEGDIDNFIMNSQQFRDKPDQWQSNGLLVYKPIIDDPNGYAAWAYTWGLNNFGQLPGINMEETDSLIFYVKGKGTIEIIVGGTNRPPFHNAGYLYEDGVDARSTGYFSLTSGNVWKRHALYLLDNRFWVYKGPIAGANNKFPTVAKFKDINDCSDYLNVSLDSTDETGKECIAVSWNRPDSIAMSPTQSYCFGGFGLLSPNINVSDWDLKHAQGYDLSGLDSICFKAKMTKAGKIEMYFNSDSCPGNKFVKDLSIGKSWSRYSIAVPKDSVYNRTNLGFGVVLQSLNQTFTPDSVTLFLDSIYYIGASLKTKFDSLITGTKILVTKKHNPDSATIQFDSIYFNRSRLNEPRMPQSFVIPNSDSLFWTQQMTSNTYDASLVAIAFLAEYYKSGNGSWLKDAEKIGDALLYAMENDRHFTDGRLRNVYAAGIHYDVNGKARLPGYWNERTGDWHEELNDVSTSTGNLAWAALSLISLYESNANSKYLDAAEKLANWCIQNTWSNKGFSAGYRGWETSQIKLEYTSTEHCIDLYAVFTRLFEITKKQEYKNAATHADEFITSMWDNGNNKFFSGTNYDGSGIFNDVIPVDLQSWYLLSHNDNSSNYSKSYFWAKDSVYLNDHTHSGDSHVYKGFDFSRCQSEILDGIGYEFTGQMATCACWLGDTLFYRSLIDEIEYIQSNGPRSNGKGIISACHDHLTTCYNWEYHNMLHTGGATCWYLFAKEHINPFYNPKFPFSCKEIVAAKQEKGITNSFLISPNPSNGFVGIYLDLLNQQHISISVLNSNGEIVCNLLNRKSFTPGAQHFFFELSDLPGSLYFICIQTETGKVVRKLALTH